MNWSDSRKSYKSPEETQAIQGFSSLEPSTPTQKGKNHTFNTGGKKDSAKALPRQCPYHFNNPTHICLTCRKSICLRCAITYCQQHNIHTHDEIMSILKKDLLSFHVQPKIQQIQIKLSQSKQRQQYLQSKASKLLDAIDKHFEQLVIVLQQKKQQIIQYYEEQFARHLAEYQKHDQDMIHKLNWLKMIVESHRNEESGSTIEEIDNLMQVIDRQASESKAEKKVAKVLLGKDKFRSDKLWSEENLQRVLYEIQNIVYKGSLDDTKCEKRKKRMTTENAIDYRSTLLGVKSSSGSRIPSGRKGFPDAN